MLLNFFCRHYFALATNSGEQFNAFCKLAAWLINVCGNDFDEPQEVTQKLNI